MQKLHRTSTLGIFPALVLLICQSPQAADDRRPADFEVWGKEFVSVKDQRYGVENVSTADGIEPWGTLATRSAYGRFDPALFFYSGELSYFSQKPMDLLRDGSTLAPQNGGDVFGIGFKWLKPLEAGYEYEFHLAFTNLPDLIAIDNDVVWDSSGGYTKPHTGAPSVSEVVFHYVPRRSGQGMIWCVKDGTDGAIIMSDTPQFWCSRRPARPASAASYRQFSPPYEVKQTKKLYTYFDEEHRVPLTGWKKRPIKRPDYPTENTVVLNNTGLVKDNVPDEPGFLGHPKVPYSFFNLLADNGIRGTMLWGYILPENPEKSKKTDEEMIKRGLDTFYVDLPDEGRWLDPNPAFHNWGYGDKPKRIEDLDQWRTINYIMDNYPEAKIMLLVGGELEHVQFLTYPRTEHKFELVRRAYIEQHGQWVKKLKKNLHHPEKVVTAEQSLGCAYPLAYLLKNYDMSMTKTWGRQNVQINIATNRGACRAYGQPMMMADDPWIGGVWCTRSPEEMEQVWHLSYFSGVDYLYHEYLGFVQKGSKIYPNKWGEKELNFGRFAAVHPKRGKQIVKLGIKRGFGDDWSLIQSDYTTGAWGHSKNFRTGEDIADYTLLNAFFPSFGDCSHTSVYRLCTGAPFGPVDMVPWDAPVEHLKTYDVLVYFGLNAMDNRQYRALKDYVQQGGTLVIALGQLRLEGKDPREVIPEALDDAFLGAELDRMPKMLGNAEILFQQNPGTVNGFYEITPTTAEVIAKTKDGRPVVVRNGCGKGHVYFYATDFISKVDDESNIRFLSGLAKPSSLLDIGPASDWIEYTVWQKGKTYIIPIFNHGRVRFPSGNGPDHGVWKGHITLDFDKFSSLRNTELEAYHVMFQDPNMKLTSIPVTRTKGGARVDLIVDKRAEVVIGPKGLARKEFFYGQ
ncbi:MAG: beta-galactosidase trimerization domain-containing protein [Armatimonadetes bacterium]|nr:beta-galactosidase trimerization domain-containing protein [Armatimonadota bacterium]